MSALGKLRWAARSIWRGTDGRARNGWWILGFFVLLAPLMAGVSLLSPEGPAGFGPAARLAIANLFVAGLAFGAAFLATRAQWLRRARQALVVGAIVLAAGAPLWPGDARAAAGDDYALALRRKLHVEGEGPQRFSISQRLRHYGVPGVGVAVVDGCRVVDARGFGLAEPGGRPVDAGTLFQAGSISKVVATVAALRLVERGALSLDGDITEAMGGWPLPRATGSGHAPVSLRALLTHTAGINVAGFKGYAQGGPVPSLRDVFDGAASANTPAIRVEQAPGAGWRYSGGGFVLVQHLVEQAEGASFADAMDSIVLGPAGMLASDFRPPDGPTRRRRAAHGVLPDGEPIAGGWRVYPEQAAAGLWTTPTDLSLFAIELVRSLRREPRPLLAPESAAEMMRRQAGAWGLGVELAPDGAPRRFSHTGAPVGFRSLWLMYPDTCQGATIMSNGDEGMTLAYEIARAIAEAYRWPDPMPSEHIRAINAGPEVLARFVGAYELVDFPTERFEVSITAEGRLAWSREGRRRRDLVAIAPGELVSPDSGLRLVAPAAGAQTGPASMLELQFPGGSNRARRIPAGQPRSPETHVPRRTP